MAMATLESVFIHDYFRGPVESLSWGMVLAAHVEVTRWLRSGLPQKTIGDHTAEEWLPILEEAIKFFEERDKQRTEPIGAF